MAQVGPPSEDRPISDFKRRYEHRREIARGGMGRVSLAFDLFEQREVAIKTIRLKGFDDPERGLKLQKMWLNESRLAGKLLHPNIARVFEAGTTRNHGYLVMEYIAGGTLKNYCSPDHLLPLDIVVDQLYKICNALEYAHQLGLLHRDIKPANVLVGLDGEPKLADFGAAFVLDSDVTQVGEVGTLPYMAPEHFNNAPPTMQSDIYALGVMGYQLLTGALPFTAETQEAMVFQKISDNTVPLDLRRPGLPAHLRFVIHRAMQPNLEVRYPSWREFCEDLAQALPGLIQRPSAKLDSSRFDTLRGLAFFRDFTHTELWETVHLGRWQTRNAGEILIEEGGVGSSVFVIALGEASVWREGREINRMVSGDCFGELAFIDEEKHQHTATVSAASELAMVELPAAALKQASDALQSRLARGLMRQLATRLRQADQRYLSMRAD